MHHRTLADLMTQDVVRARRDTPFKEIVRLLAENDVTAVPVVDERLCVLTQLPVRARIQTAREWADWSGSPSRRAGLQTGVCGEHGGDPESIHFFHTVGLDYVSCSPFRVPVARLEAGRAALNGMDSSDSR